MGTLAVVVAVDHRTPQLRAYLIELVADVRHLVGAVFIPGNDLIDRVNDDSDVFLIG